MTVGSSRCCLYMLILAQRRRNGYKCTEERSIQATGGSYALVLLYVYLSGLSPFHSCPLPHLSYLLPTPDKNSSSNRNNIQEVESPKTLTGRRPSPCTHAQCCGIVHKNCSKDEITSTQRNRSACPCCVAYKLRSLGYEILWEDAPWRHNIP